MSYCYACGCAGAPSEAWTAYPCGRHNGECPEVIEALRDFSDAGGIHALSADVRAYAQWLGEHFGADGPDGDDYGNVRLQYFGGEYSLLTGDSQYDQDHRGYWGSTSVRYDCGIEEACDAAECLLEQVLDAVAEAASPCDVG